MELSQLPSEMVAAIADLLGARDIAACSGVNRSWRRAFNLDRVWRRYCSFGPEFYKDESNTVKPSFQVPFVEGVDLEPLCEWRVNFLKESYIMKNWEKVRFSSEEAEIHGNVCLYMKEGVDTRGNHWMFLCCTSREGLRLQVWSLKDFPCLQTSMKMYDISKFIEEAVQNEAVRFNLHLSGQRLLFIVNNLISVYDFSPPHYKISFLCTLSVVHTHPFFVPKRLPQLPSGSVCEVRVVENLLFAVTYMAIHVSQQFSPSVHVWDMEKSVKVNDHCVFESKESPFETVGTISLTHGISDFLIITQTYDVMTSVTVKKSRVRAFDMKRFEYSNFYVKTMSPVIWSAVAGEVLVFCELLSSQERDCVFHFYDLHSNKCLLQTSTYNIYDPEKISSSGSKFAFIDLNSEVRVFDILTQESFASKLHPSRNRLKTLTLVNDHLLLLESKYKGTKRSFEDVLITSYEIWDFLNKPKPVRLDRCFRSVRRTKFTFMKDCRVPPKLLTLVHPLYRPNMIYVDSFW
ncbi:uncharacterized protein LOC128998308 [Macrosteles quadrilineatus]|uniref:uncharacterized protein LOC128998289 n=1 Tax=Macrosteles quadrilineatus TaxID=74068 RepID=UPI0023E150E6|nr:uncharacterized protein LOC128998289 [Macrosteles quadrilineatus]XP_054280363.1 uncharacterized protein LOC128998308 [Macrosteles quadrilineatus]